MQIIRRRNSDYMLEASETSLFRDVGGLWEPLFWS